MSANVHDSTLVGQVIRQKRRKLGLNQGELSDLSGVSRRTISSLENGKASIQLDGLVAVLTVLGLKLDIRED